MVAEINEREAKTLLACLVKLAKYEGEDTVGAILKNDKGGLSHVGAEDLRDKLMIGAAALLSR